MGLSRSEYGELKAGLYLRPGLPKIQNLIGLLLLCNVLNVTFFLANVTIQTYFQMYYIVNLHLELS